MIRYFSLKRPNIDSTALASALNLLSRTGSSSGSSRFRPSILASASSGGVAEQLAAELAKPSPSTTPSHVDPATIFAGGLMAGLSASTANQLSLQEMSPADLARHVSSLSLESEVLSTFNVLYSQKSLSLPVLTRIVLNKSFKNLSACPFDLESLHILRILGWENPVDYARFNIVLLKKYHDLRKPLSIRKNLRTQFEAQYWPLIQSSSLSPFYERIVWKFYFELVAPRTEQHFLQQLPLRSAFLIYESSLHDHKRVASYIAENMQLSLLQRIFFDFCNSEYMERAVEKEILESAGRVSPLLSLVKRLSTKHKLFAVSDEATGVSARLNVFAFIKAFQSLLESAGPDPHILDLRNRLVQTRQELVKQQVDELCDLQAEALIV